MRNTQIWSVCSGKGGVGKTFLTANLGITLARSGFSVVIVDADTSGANLHTSLGVLPPRKNIESYLTGSEELCQIVQTTGLPHLSFIGGSSFLGAVVKSAEQILNDLKTLPFDFVILDHGSKLSEPFAEVIRRSHEIFLVTTPDPSAIEKNYRWIESFIALDLAQEASPEALKKITQALEDFKALKTKRNFDFRRYLRLEHGISQDHFERLSRKPLRLLVNESRTPGDSELGDAMKSVATKFYDFPLDPVAVIEYDNAAWQSLRNREAFLISKPFSPIAGELLVLIKHLLGPSFFETNQKAVI